MKNMTQAIAISVVTAAITVMSAGINEAVPLPSRSGKSLNSYSEMSKRSVQKTFRRQSNNGSSTSAGQACANRAFNKYNFCVLAVLRDTRPSDTLMINSKIAHCGAILEIDIKACSGKKLSGGGGALAQ